MEALKEMLLPLLSQLRCSAPCLVWGSSSTGQGRAGRQRDGEAFCSLCVSFHVEMTAVPPVLQVRMVRGELVDEAGSSALEWIGLIRAARNSQEQTLEAVADLPGGQVPHSRLRAGMAPLSATCLPSQAS